MVTGRKWVFTNKGQAVKCQKIGGEVGVRCVREGRVRRAGNGVRINDQLERTIDGTHIWAERFDREIRDVFALQDAVTRKLVTAPAITLTQGEEQRVSRRGEVSPEADDMLLPGLERRRRYTPEGKLLARAYGEPAQAMVRDVSHAHADHAVS